MGSGSKDLLRQFFNGDSIIIIMMAAFLLVITIVILLGLKIKKENEEAEGIQSEKNRIGRRIATFIPLGFAISLPIGIALKQIIVGIALGPAFGLALGVVIGSMKEKKLGKGKRPLTPREIEFKGVSQLILTGLIALGAVLYWVTYFVLK